MRILALALIVACNDPGGAVCGDGVLDGTESCDDGNDVVGDGCSSTCRTEPRVHVTWAFYPKLGEPAQAGCRDDVVAIEVVSQPIRAGFYDVKLEGETFSEQRSAVEVGANNRVTELSFD